MGFVAGGKVSDLGRKSCLVGLFALDFVQTFSHRSNLDNIPFPGRLENADRGLFLAARCSPAAGVRDPGVSSAGLAGLGLLASGLTLWGGT